MRNISFALTTPQFRARTKTVTRRLGWEFLRPGDRLMACVKCQGLKPGEVLERLGEIVVTDVRRERLDAITPEDVVKEGFPEMTRGEFIAMFCDHMGCGRWRRVTRIEFQYVEESAS